VSGVDPILALVFALIGGVLTSWLLKTFRIRLRRRTRAVVVVGAGIVLGGMAAGILFDR
jgi:hypothetical protein